MQKMKIEKRILAEIEGIRKMAGFLPGGKARALQNKCNKIAMQARKAQAMVDAPVGSLFPTHAGYDARIQEDMAAQAASRQAVFNAMVAGRRITLCDAAEFRLSQMHTAISCIRKDIARRHPDIMLCDEWVRPEGRRPYKRYWIAKKEEWE